MQNTKGLHSFRGRTRGESRTAQGSAGPRAVPMVWDAPCSPATSDGAVQGVGLFTCHCSEVRMKVQKWHPPALTEAR